MKKLLILVLALLAMTACTDSTSSSEVYEVAFPYKTLSKQGGYADVILDTTSMRAEILDDKHISITLSNDESTTENTYAYTIESTTIGNAYHIVTDKGTMLLLPEAQGASGPILAILEDEPKLIFTVHIDDATLMLNFLHPGTRYVSDT